MIFYFMYSMNFPSQFGQLFFNTSNNIPINAFMYFNLLISKHNTNRYVKNYMGKIDKYKL